MKTNCKQFAIIVFLYLTFTTATAQSTQRVNIDGSVGRLSAILHQPSLKRGEKCPIVIICHGFTGNKDWSLFISLADTLQAHGIATIRFDFNAHGDSDGDFVNMTVPNEIEDAKCVYHYAVNLPFIDTHRIGMVGHSQGGVVVSMVAGELKDSLSAIVLLAPAAVLRDDAIRGNTMGAIYDPLSPPEYVELPSGHHLGCKFIQTAFSLPIYETAEQYRGAACIIHGTGDRIVPYTYSERYHRIWQNSELHILDGVDHSFNHNLQLVTSIATHYLVEQLLRTE